MSYYTPNMMKASTAVETRLPALGIQLDAKMHTGVPAIPPMLRLHAGQAPGALKISLTPCAAPARLSIYPSDACAAPARLSIYPSDACAVAHEKPAACAPDNLIRQIPRLRESLSALDDEIHSEMTTPDHAETMRIHGKILQLQDKRMNEVEGRLNTLAKDGDEKSGLFEELHHASGARIVAMSAQLDLHQQLHHATGHKVLGMAREAPDASCARARTVDQQLRDLTQAGEISRDVIVQCQERLGDVSAASRKAQLAQDAHRQVQTELGDMRQDMNELARKVEQAAGAAARSAACDRQLQSEVASSEAHRKLQSAAPSNEALLRQVAVSVIDIQKMLGASSKDVASLSRKVQDMETQLDTSQSHAATFSLLQRDMLSGQRPKKTRS